MKYNMEDLRVDLMDVENRAEWRRSTRVAEPSPEGSKPAWRRERKKTVTHPSQSHRHSVYKRHDRELNPRPGDRSCVNALCWSYGRVARNGEIPYLCGKQMVRTVIQQHRHHVFVTFLAGNVERRVEIFRGSVRWRAVLKQ